ESLPAGSVAIAVTVLPSVIPGFGTVQSPFESALTFAVVSSGKVSVTVEPDSAVSVIGSVALIGSITGAAGATPSTVVVASVESLPAGSVVIGGTQASTRSPRNLPGQSPLETATTAAAVPSGK